MLTNKLKFSLSLYHSSDLEDPATDSLDNSSTNTNTSTSTSTPPIEDPTTVTSTNVDKTRFGNQMKNIVNGTENVISRRKVEIIERANGTVESMVISINSSGNSTESGLAFIIDERRSSSDFVTPSFLWVSLAYTSGLVNGLAVRL